MKLSKCSLPLAVFFLLMLLFNPETGLAQDPTRKKVTCRHKSETFTGNCFLDAPCSISCLKEGKGYLRGRCIGFAVKKCYCYKC